MPTPTLESLQQQQNQTQEDLKRFKVDYSIHQHSNVDGTNSLRKTITLDQDQVAMFGSMQARSKQSYTVAKGLVYEGILETGSQMLQTTAVQSPNMQVVLRQFDAVSADISELYGQANPIVFPYQNTALSVTAAGNTVTIDGYAFVVNSLGGSVINIYDSTGAFVEAQVISSNTSTVITITDTWVNSTSNATFLIYNRAALGSTEHVWQRVHVWHGSSGGVWFGAGAVVQGQVSELFTNPTTFDLEYAYPFGNPGGVVNLSASAAAVEAGSGVSGSFFVSSDGVNLDTTVTVTDGIITNIV